MTLIEQTPPSPETNLETARAFLDAWSRSDTDAYLPLVGEGLQFASPRVNLEGPAALEALADFSQVVTSVTEVAAAASDDFALVLYDMHTGPFGTSAPTTGTCSIRTAPSSGWRCSSTRLP